MILDCPDRLEQDLARLPDPSDPATAHDHATLAERLGGMAFEDFDRLWIAGLSEFAQAGRTKAVCLALLVVRERYRDRAARHAQAEWARTVDRRAQRVREQLGPQRPVVALHELVRSRQLRALIGRALERDSDLIVIRRARQGIFVTLA